MTTEPPTPVRQILLATDFSRSAEPAARVARDYARQFGARLHVLHVVSVAEDPMPRPLLAGVAADLGTDVPVVTAVESGVPAVRIVDYARRHGVDLIVMGSHGRTGFTRVLLGSVAERVVRMAPCPVLTVPREGPTRKVAEEVEPTRDGCIVCARPSEDLICEPCRVHIRREALERKRREERAGRP